MTIWMDADACPRPVREILYRAAERTRTPLVMVANQMLAFPPSPWIRMRQVPGGFDVADDEIIACVEPGDLVVTQDIPLAARVIEVGAEALSPRGEVFNAETIRERLSVRDFLESMRSAGLETGGPASFGANDRQTFGAALDRWLAQNRR